MDERGGQNGKYPEKQNRIIGSQEQNKKNKRKQTNILEQNTTIKIQKIQPNKAAHKQDPVKRPALARVKAVIYSVLLFFSAHRCTNSKQMTHNQWLSEFRM